MRSSRIGGAEFKWVSRSCKSHATHFGTHPRVRVARRWGCPHPVILSSRMTRFAHCVYSVCPHTEITPAEETTMTNQSIDQRPVTTDYSGLTIDHVIEWDCLGDLDDLDDRADYDRYRAMVADAIECALPGATVACSVGPTSRTEIVDSGATMDVIAYDEVRQACKEAARLAYLDFCR